MTEPLLEKLDRLAKETGIKEITPEIRKFALLVREDVVAQWPRRPLVGQPAQQEPVGYVYSESGLKNAAIQKDVPNGTSLYTSPPAQQDIQRLSALVRAQQITIDKLEAQRKPLTDAEIGKCIDEVNATSQYGHHHFGWHLRLAQAIEAAHGIKENT